MGPNFNDYSLWLTLIKFVVHKELNQVAVEHQAQRQNCNELFRLLTVPKGPLPDYYKQLWRNVGRVRCDKTQVTLISNKSLEEKLRSSTLCLSISQVFSHS